MQSVMYIMYSCTIRQAYLDYTVTDKPTPSGFQKWWWRWYCYCKFFPV